MGGFGSTRWGFHRRRTAVEDGRWFTIASILHGRPPAPGASGTLTWRGTSGSSASIGYEVVPGPAVRLRYDWTPRLPEAAARSIVLDVQLVPGVVPNGGSRWWGVCPLAPVGGACGRRVGKLYLPPGSPYFGCRHCHRLAYRSSQAHDKRVSRLLQDREGLLRWAGNPATLSLQDLGLALAALTELQRRHDRESRRFETKYGKTN